MRILSRTRILAAAALAAAAGATAGAGAAAGGAVPGPAPDQRITPRGVGAVELGSRHAALRRAGLVGRLRPGCELEGPDTRSARLRRPLRGSVDYTTDTPRRVRRIAVLGGATARGVGVGDRRAAIRAAFPRARVDRSTEPVFGITLFRVPRSGGGRIAFAVDVDTRRVTLIGVPRIAFCE